MYLLPPPPPHIYTVCTFVSYTRLPANTADSHASHQNGSAELLHIHSFLQAMENITKKHAVLYARLL